MIDQKKIEIKMPRKKGVLRSGVFYKIYRRFIKIRGNPREIALGFSLGLFIGFSPTMGFQIIIAVFLAALLGWNKLTAGMGVMITNPVTAPFIYSATYVLGSEILGLDHQFGFSEGFTFTALVHMLKEAPSIFAALTIGGIFIGVPLALAGYYIAYSLVQKYQDDLKKTLEKQKQKLAERKMRKKTKKYSLPAKKQ